MTPTNTESVTYSLNRLVTIYCFCTELLYCIVNAMSKTHSRTGEFRKTGENLYRYSSNGIYYAVFRDKSKLKWKSLKTTDRALAKRRLTEVVDQARRIDPTASKMSLSKLLELYETQIKGLKNKTYKTRGSIQKIFKATWTHGLEIQVRDVNQAQLEGWLTQHRKRLRKSSLNEYIRFVRQLFAIAVKSKVITDSPCAPIKQEKRETPIRDTPDWNQFHAIVQEIRAQPFNADAANSADLVEFMGLAGVGIAEADNLTWDHFNFETNQIKLYRKKTDPGYTIPIFPQLRPLLDRLKAKGQIKSGQETFLIRDPRRALKTATVRLHFLPYSSRALRRCFITRCIELGIDFKTISAWQGHNDGGVLIAKTYSHLRSEHSDNMAKKLVESASPNPNPT